MTHLLLILFTLNILFVLTIIYVFFRLTIRNGVDEWLEKLRSGDYIQTTRRLRDSSNRFCCLGVLGTCYPYTKWVKGSGSYKLTSTIHKNIKPEIGVLTRVIIEYFGGVYYLENPDYNFNKTHFNRTLYNLNDEKKYTFSQIADYVVENRKMLFPNERNRPF